MTHIVAEYDANDPFFRHHVGQPYLHDFLAAHGIDWMLCHRFEILADGDGQLRTYSWTPDRDEIPPAMTPLRAPIPRELQAA